MASKAGLANSASQVFQAIVPGKSYQITASGTDTIIGPFSAGVSVVRIVTTTNSIFVKFGASPVTTDPNDRCYIPPSYVEYFSIPADDYLAISGSGVVYINEAAIEAV